MHWLWPFTPKRPAHECHMVEILRTYAPPVRASDRPKWTPGRTKDSRDVWGNPIPFWTDEELEAYERMVHGCTTVVRKCIGCGEIEEYQFLGKVDTGTETL